MLDKTRWRVPFKQNRSKGAGVALLDMRQDFLARRIRKASYDGMQESAMSASAKATAPQYRWYKSIELKTNLSVDC